MIAILFNRAPSASHRFYEQLLPRLHSKSPPFILAQEHVKRLDARYAGELRVDRTIEQLPNETLYLKDVQLEVNGENFQLDGILFTKTSMLLLEMKNMIGTLHIEPNTHQFTRTLATGQTEGMKNPLDQLARNATCIRQLLKNYHLHIPVHELLIFSNTQSLLTKSFHTDGIVHLYGLPAKWETFLDRNKTQFWDAKLPPIEQSGKNFASEILPSEKELNLVEIEELLKKYQTPAKRFIPYNYAEIKPHIRKGVLCKCGATLHFKNSLWRCQRCGYKGKNDHLGALEAYRVLFSDEITTKEWMEFSGMTDVSTAKRMLSRVPYLEVISRNRYQRYKIRDVRENS
ncbi:nuclease-related domain-containing protein [Paenisporosarcina cavernae]|uniref:nuclease-related domain-containing protein n=1 Tax=Paenisporosarcina cavernae TaxID=2320858 RepID=UPI0013C4C25F|nr:nuclease-related domain-containing protein [Paenisporosarcina cavernae]